MVEIGSGAKRQVADVHLSRYACYLIVQNGDALEFNPDRRFPNLDKILPLPPAPLPPWGGTRESLLAAPMAVVPAPVIPAPAEASLRKDRYFLDSAYAFRPVAETTDALQAPFSSY